MQHSNSAKSDEKPSTPEPASLAHDVAAYPGRIADLLAPFTAPVTPAARAWLDAQIKEAKARKDGAEVASPLVLDAVVEATHTARQALLDGKVIGYGPLRYRYCLDLAVALADKVAHFDASVVGAAGASAAKGSSLRDSVGDRRSAIRVLKNLTASDDMARARLKKVRGRDEKPDERAASLQGISKELEAVTAGVPKELVQDAGVTPDLSQRLNSYAHAVVSTHDTAHEERASIAAQYDSMNVLDGRILHELRALVGAMSDARKSDKSVPALKIAVLRSRKKKKAPSAKDTSRADTKVSG